MSEWKSRKFWTDVAIDRVDEGWRVMLDGRPIRTPFRSPLHLPTEPLARMVADEWSAQEDQIRPDRMPATRRANSAIDKVIPERRGVVDVIAAYGETDLLCYRAEAPAQLVREQARAWDPVLDWAAREIGARLSVTSGVIPVDQEPGAIGRFRVELDALDPFALTAMHDLVSLTGSLVLGIAVGRDALAPDRAWQLSCLDEDWQISQWGRDDEADAAAAHKRADFLDAVKFHRAARAGTSDFRH